MSERDLLLEIIDALEEHGLSHDEYQLHRWVDGEALERLVDSANVDFEIQFSVDEFRLLVTRSGVQVISNPSKEWEEDRDTL